MPVSTNGASDQPQVQCVWPFTDELYWATGVPEGLREEGLLYLDSGSLQIFVVNPLLPINKLP